MPATPGERNYKRKRDNNAIAGVMLPLVEADPQMPHHADAQLHQQHHDQDHSLPLDHHHHHHHHHHPADLDPHDPYEENIQVVVQHVQTNHLGIPHTDLAAPNRDDLLFHLKAHKNHTNLVQGAILLSPLNTLNKKSPFWQAFHQFNPKHGDNANRPHHACCNLCGKTINMGRDNSTTTLAQHLRKCNKDLWGKLKAVVVVKSIESNNSNIHNSKSSNNSLDCGNGQERGGTNGLIHKLVNAEELRQYIKIAIVLRFKFPPEEEWPGLISILRKEIGNKLAKEHIRDIFRQYCRRNRTKGGINNATTTYHATVVTSTGTRGKRQRATQPQPPPPPQQLPHLQNPHSHQVHQDPPGQTATTQHDHQPSEGGDIEDFDDDDVDDAEGIHEHYHPTHAHQHHYGAHTNTRIHNEGSDAEGTSRDVGLNLDHSFAGL